MARFECQSRLRLISTWVYLLLFAAMAGLWTAAAGGAFAGATVSFGSDKVLVTGPYALSQTITLLGFLGVSIVAAMTGRSVQQDFEHRSFYFFFSAPLRKRDYWLGRFLGAYLTLTVVFLGIVPGLLIASWLPGLDEARVGAMSLQGLLRPYLFVLLPNQLWLGACFFTLAALMRRMLPVYVAGIVVLLGYMLSLSLLSDLENQRLASMLDPMGSTALSTQTRYWSVHELNTRHITLSGMLLWNRLAWCGLGLLVFGFGYRRFALRAPGEPTRQASAAAAPQPSTELPHRSGGEFGTGAWLAGLPSLMRLYLRDTVRSVYFLVIVLAGVIFVFGNASTLGSMYGTDTVPVTYQVLELTSGLFSLFILVITAIYAGELVWRERDAGVAAITDSLPQPNWLPFLAKLLTLFAVQGLLLIVVMLCGMLIQLLQGYTRLEPGQYLYELFALQLPKYWIIAALALTVHVLVNQKYAAHFLVVAFFVLNGQLPTLGLEDRLYRFASTPPVTYSDMNGYGHFLPAVRWFQLYWGAFALLLLVLAQLFWVRGAESGWRSRLAQLRLRWSLPLAVVTLNAALLFAGCGIYVYYNTHRLNTFRSGFAAEALQAEYERRYKPLADAAQPRVTAVNTTVELFPHEHRVVIEGEQTLRNRSDEAIGSLYLNLPETAGIHALQTSWPSDVVASEPSLHWHELKFREALPPGQEFTLRFELEYAASGFGNDGASKTIVDNGSFINSDLFPHYGYDESRELVAERTRRKHGLDARPRDHDLDDERYRQRNYVSGDGDWIDFEATVVTEPDQIALAPGTLQKEWTENGRRHFHYKMDVPILNFYAFLSARYAVAHDEWIDGERRVPIEIYHQPGHEYNLERMFAGVKDALQDYSHAYSPYQHQQVRILEFPRYATFAQSFPNTIPFSESIGFIAKVRDDDPQDIDYPYYVTAHEIAHQWWAHQIIGADVQGARTLSETLSQYAALMVMRQRFGDAKMQRFLGYELDRYLRGRSTENEQELPLYREESQPYIYYRKGSVLTYWLADVIGKDRFDRALALLLERWAYQGPPYPTSRALIDALREVTPEDAQYLIEDGFEHITLYENRTRSATARALDDGRYELTIEYTARKVRADGEGRETEQPMDDFVDVGVFDAEQQPLRLEKRRLAGGEGSLRLIVDGKPARAGIDPLNKLVDRDPDDNRVPVEFE